MSLQEIKPNLSFQAFIQHTMSLQEIKPNLSFQALLHFIYFNY